MSVIFPWLCVSSPPLRSASTPPTVPLSGYFTSPFLFSPLICFFACSIYSVISDSASFSTIVFAALAESYVSAIVNLFFSTFVDYMLEIEISIFFFWEMKFGLCVFSGCICSYWNLSKIITMLWVTFLIKEIGQHNLVISLFQSRGFWKHLPHLVKYLILIFGSSLYLGLGLVW